MADFLDILAKTAKKNLKTGYYNEISSINRINVSLKQAIINEDKAPVISEIKAASPSAGIIREKIYPEVIAKSMKRWRDSNFCFNRAYLLQRLFSYT